MFDSFLNMSPNNFNNMSSCNKLQQITTNYNKLQQITTNYNKLQQITTNYNKLQQITKL